jgi:hypothetical protein
VASKDLTAGVFVLAARNAPEKATRMTAAAPSFFMDSSGRDSRYGAVRFSTRE